MVLLLWSTLEAAWEKFTPKFTVSIHEHAHYLNMLLLLPLLLPLLLQQVGEGVGESVLFVVAHTALRGVRAFVALPPPT